MQITKTSPITDKENTLDLDITQEQLDNWNNGELIQRAMPNLTADEREFLISGMYPGEYDALFDEDDDEPDHTETEVEPSDDEIDEPQLGARERNLEFGGEDY